MVSANCIAGGQEEGAGRWGWVRKRGMQERRRSRPLLVTVPSNFLLSPCIERKTLYLVVLLLSCSCFSYVSYPRPVILCILCHAVVSLTRFNAVSEDEFIPPWALARFDVTALGSKERKKAELWGFSVAQSSSSLHSASSSQVTHLSVRSPSPVSYYRLLYIVISSLVHGLFCFFSHFSCFFPLSFISAWLLI